MLEQIAIIGIVFLACFTQSVSGFGVALVAIGLLPGLLDMHTAIPLVALIALTMQIGLLFIYHETLNFRAITPVIVAAVISVPLGLWVFKKVDENTFMTILGIILILYSLNAMFHISLPELHHPAWAVVTGIIAGVLAGAYTMAGPPIVIYGNARRWPPAEFKANLQGFFMVISIALIASHAYSGNLTTVVWKQYAYALIPMGLGLLAGISLDRFIDIKTFSRLVLWLLLLMGIRLVVTHVS